MPRGIFVAWLLPFKWLKSESSIPFILNCDKTDRSVSKILANRQYLQLNSSPCDVRVQRKPTLCNACQKFFAINLRSWAEFFADTHKSPFQGTTEFDIALATIFSILFFGILWLLLRFAFCLWKSKKFENYEIWTKKSLTNKLKLTGLKFAPLCSVHCFRTMSISHHFIRLFICHFDFAFHDFTNFKDSTSFGLMSNGGLMWEIEKGVDLNLRKSHVFFYYERL